MNTQKLHNCMNVDNLLHQDLKAVKGLRTQLMISTWLNVALLAVLFFKYVTVFSVQ